MSSASGRLNQSVTSQISLVFGGGSGGFRNRKGYGIFLTLFYTIFFVMSGIVITGVGMNFL